MTPAIAIVAAIIAATNINSHQPCVAASNGDATDSLDMLGNYMYTMYAFSRRKHARSNARDSLLSPRARSIHTSRTPSGWLAAAKNKYQHHAFWECAVLCSMEFCKVVPLVRREHKIPNHDILLVSAALSDTIITCFLR